MSSHLRYLQLNCAILYESLRQRLIRADANRLCCGRRSCRTLECWLAPAQLDVPVITLYDPQPTQDQSNSPQRIVSIGSVGRNLGKSTSALYS